MGVALTYNGSMLSTNGSAWTASGLPPFTILLRFTYGVTPTFSKGTAVQVSSSPNLWELTYNNTDWTMLCNEQMDLLEVVGANTTGVLSMHSLFRQCRNMTAVSLFDTSTVVDMCDMFISCRGISTVPLFDTSSATTMQGMFFDCSGLETVPLFNTSSVTTMQGMFNGCVNLESVPPFDTSSVTNMWEMFSSCWKLVTAPAFDTSSVTQMWNMFVDCRSLVAVPLYDTSSVTAMQYMFRGCYNVESGALALYQQASGQAVPPSNHTGTFKNCGVNTVTGAAELAEIASDWK